MSQPGPSRPRRRPAPKPTGKWRTKPRSEMTDNDYRTEFREKFGELKKNMRNVFDRYLSRIGVSRIRIQPIRDALFGNTSQLFPCEDRVRHFISGLSNTQVNELCQIVNIYRQLLNKNPYLTYIDGPQSEYYIHAHPGRSSEILPVTMDNNFRAKMLKSAGSANQTYNVARKLVVQAIEIANRHLDRDDSDKIIYNSDIDSD